MISIIIPIYNVERYLSQCLESVINQTYKELEIICINDGSPDNSLKILEKFQKKDNRIKLITQKNQGLAGARNTGINNATGEFIFFLDSDDWLPLNAIELLYNKQKNEDADIVIGGRNTITLKKENKFFPKSYEKNLKFKEYIMRSFKDKSFRAVAWGKLYKKDIIKKYRLYFPKGLLYEDLLFLMRYLYYSKKITVLSECVYNYRYDRKDSIINTINTKDMDCLKTVEELETFFRKEGLEELPNQDYYIRYVTEWIIYATIGKFYRKKIKYQTFKEYVEQLEKKMIFNKYLNNFLKIEISSVNGFKNKVSLLRNKIYLFGIKKKQIKGLYLFILLNRIILLIN